MTHYSSKHGTVNRPQAELFMVFTDPRNLTRMVPAEKLGEVTADYDSISVKAQGISISARIVRREPYSYIELRSENAPFEFTVGLHFDYVGPNSTEFYIEVDADLNFMLKMMLGNKLQEALDRVVDGLVDVSNGKIPEDLPQDIKDKYNFS
jgi:hypothetical protein